MKNFTFKSIFTVAIMLLFFNGVKAQSDTTAVKICLSNRGSNIPLAVDYLSTLPTAEPGDAPTQGSTNSTYKWFVNGSGVTLTVPAATGNTNGLNSLTASPGVYHISVVETRGSDCPDTSVLRYIIADSLPKPVVDPFCSNNPDPSSKKITGKVTFSVDPSTRPVKVNIFKGTNKINTTSISLTGTGTTRTWSYDYTGTTISPSDEITAVLVDETVDNLTANPPIYAFCDSPKSDVVKSSGVKISPIKVN